MNIISKVVIIVILIFISILSSRYALAEDRAALKYFQNGEEYFNASKYDKALDMYKKAVDERSTDGSISIQEEKIKMVRRGRVVEKEVSYDVHYEDFYPNRRIAEIEKTLEELAAPCDLVVTSRFQDGNTVQANNSLDPDENGVLLVTVKNSGKGAAFKTNLQISSDNSWIEYDKWVELGDIKPGETIEKRINLRAETNVGDGRAKFTLAFKEKRGKYDVSETAYVPTAKQELPQLEIIADKELDDSDGPSPNGMLDGGENVYMNLTIKNSGKGRADNTRLEIASDNRYIDFEKNVNVGDFKPGEEKRVRIPLHASYDVDSGKVKIALSLTEDRGFDAKKVVMNIPVAKLEKPKLEIVSTEINDGNSGLAKGNGNNVIESGETVELVAYIKNQGVGPALGVNLVGSNITAGVNWVSGHDSAIVGTIPPGKTLKAKVAFEVPRNFAAKDIRANLSVTDSRAIDKAEYKFAQNYSKKSPDLQYAYRISSKGALVKQIANGDDYDIELTVSNKGQLAAKNVAVSIESGKLSDRLMLSRGQMDIGDVKENGSAPAQSFTLSVPRTYATNLAVLALSIVQSGFSGITGELNIPVEIRSPKLRYTTNLGSKNGGSSLEKGEQAVLEIQVFNDGGLPAEGVRIALSSADDHLQILSQKEISIGTIPPGTSGDPVKYQIIAKGRLAVGPAKLGVDILQNEFESKSAQYALNIVEEGVTIIDIAGDRPKTTVAVSAQAGPKIMVKGAENFATGMTIEEETYRLAFEVEDSRAISTIKVTVNGRAIPEIDKIIAQAISVAKNKSKVPILLQEVPLVEGPNTIQIIAYNADNSKSAPQEIKVTRATERDVEIPPITGLNKKNAVAIVIGISKQEDKGTGGAAYAKKDALKMYDYLINQLGYSKTNIFLVTDEDARVPRLRTLFSKNLKDKVMEKRGAIDTEIFVYYSGHGYPVGEERYLLTYDYNPQDVTRSAYPVRELFEEMAKLTVKTTIVLDACYSGSTGNGEQLVKGTSAATMQTKNPADRIKKGIVFTAAASEQYANWYDEKQHGLFTYYFLQGIGGSADKNNDGKISVGELKEYVSGKVILQSQKKGDTYRQTPDIKGDDDAVVVEAYR